MNNKVQKMVSIAMLAAIGTVLQFVAFPIMPAFSFLKIDFSDIPILLGMFFVRTVSRSNYCFCSFVATPVLNRTSTAKYGGRFC